jgi:MFS family permease
MDPTDPAAGRRQPAPASPSLWRHGDFMRLWTGQTISLLGSQITVLALPLAAILLFKASAFQVGLLSTVEFLPFVLFGLPAGVWVDRMRRKPVLVVADIGRFLALGSVPLAYALGGLTLIQLYVVAFVTGIFTLFFDVAYAAYLPAFVERDRIVEANSKLEISRSGAQLAGPGIAGVLVQAFGAAVAILADAISYLVSVASLLMIRRSEPISLRQEGGRRSMGRQIVEGLGYALRHPYLRPLGACTALLNLFSTMAQAVLLLFAVRKLGLSPGVIGGALAAGNVGFLVGAFLAARVGRRVGVGPTLIAAALLLSTGNLFLPLATKSFALPMVTAYGLLGSFGGVIYNVNARSLIQSMTPDHMLGRTVATMRFIVWGTIPIGAFLGGILGGSLGLRPTLWVAAAGMLVAFLPPLFSQVRLLIDMPTEPIPIATDPGPPAGVSSP